MIARRWVIDCEHEHHLQNVPGEPEGGHEDEMHYALTRRQVYERLKADGWFRRDRMSNLPEGLICPSCVVCDECTRTGHPLADSDEA